MRRKAWFLAALAAAGMLLMTACTSSDREIAQNAGGGAAGSTGTTQEGSGDAGTQSQAGQDQAGQDQDTGGNTQGQTDASGQSDSSTQGETKAPDAGQTEGTAADGSGSSLTEDIWSGTYASEQETVTIKLVDEKTISFSFENAGIASTAEIDGTQAVYKGDDHHDVVFEMIEGVLNITVLSEEDFDTSGSPLNGVYVHQISDSDTE